MTISNLKEYGQGNCINRVTDPEDPVQTCGKEDMCAVCYLLDEVRKLKNTRGRIKNEKKLLRGQVGSLLSFKRKIQKKLTASLHSLADEYDIYLYEDCD